MVKKIDNSVSVLHFTDIKHWVLVESFTIFCYQGSFSYGPQAFLCNKCAFMSKMLVAQRTSLEYFPVKSCWEYEGRFAPKKQIFWWLLLSQPSYYYTHNLDLCVCCIPLLWMSWLERWRFTCTAKCMFKSLRASTYKKQKHQCACLLKWPLSL